VGIRGLALDFWTASREPQGSSEKRSRIMGVSNIAEACTCIKVSIAKLF
jgi:hypothetical protein